MIGMIPTLQDYIEKQRQLLDNIPGEESRGIFVCDSCGTFVYEQPVTSEGVSCVGCGDTFSREVAQRL